MLRPPKLWSSPLIHFNEAVNHPWYRAIQKLEAAVYRATNAYFDSIGFDPVFLPVTTGAVSSPMALGSDSEPVSVTLYGRQVYLADSMQFHLEYLLRHRIPGAYYIMPTFRGEDSSSRHLNEFHHSEAEFLGGLEDAIGVVTNYLQFLAEQLLKKHEALIIDAAGTIDHIEHLIKLGTNIPRMTFQEARRRLEQIPDALKAYSPKALGLTSHGEQWLMHHTGGVLFVTHFPHAVVPFYQAYSDDGVHAQTADLLMGIGETVGCGERHQNAEQLCRALEEHEVEAEPYHWYVELKRQYPLQSSGFGMGVERALLWLLRHDDIRDVPIIPRIKQVQSIP